MRVKFQKWRPLEKQDGIGDDAVGMRNDEERGLYYLCADVDPEIKYLRSELRKLGWKDERITVQPVEEEDDEE